MMGTMNNTTDPSLSISCDSCSMQSTAACDDCLVTFLFSDAAQAEPDESLVLDLDQARVVKLFGNAGLVPDLKYRVAG